jgi:hypothetical protein
VFARLIQQLAYAGNVVRRLFPYDARLQQFVMDRGDGVLVSA